MARVKLKLRSRHRKMLSRYSTTRCIVSTALHDTYGGDWVVGYGTARRKGFFSGITLRMGMSAQNAAYDHDHGESAAGRTVTLYGNPGPTLEEKRAAAAKKKRAAAKAPAVPRKAPARTPAARPARTGKPGFWAALWNPSAAAQQRPAQQPQRRPAQIVARTPAAAERARREAGSAR